MDTNVDKNIFTKIVNYTHKNDRISWNRKYKKMKTMMDETISPLEEQILELTMKKMLAIDKVIALRNILTKECVHPREFLVIKDGYILCKFCDSKLNVNV